MNWNKRTVRELVACNLKRHQPRKFALAAKEVVRDGEYWYVLVQPDKSGVRAFDYNGNLADTEEDIRQHERQPPNLLLIPVLPPDADGR